MILEDLKSETKASMVKQSKNAKKVTPDNDNTPKKNTVVQIGATKSV
jgi:hypothetical protein